MPFAKAGIMVKERLRIDKVPMRLVVDRRGALVRLDDAYHNAVPWLAASPPSLNCADQFAIALVCKVGVHDKASVNRSRQPKEDGEQEI